MLRLQTFGGLALEAAGAGSVGRLAQRRRLALLAVLVAHRHRAVGREKLLGLFWPDRRSEEARHSLAQLVYGVRHDLGDTVLLSGPDDLRTNPQAISADVTDFGDAVDQHDLELAARLYCGPFLEGFFLTEAPEFERWVEQERETLANRYALVLEQLARAAAANGKHEEAVRWWRQRAVLDPLNAAVTRQLMQSLAAAGDPAGALRQAEIHAALLHTQLEAPPDAAVMTLAREIRLEVERATVRPPSPPTVAPESRDEHNERLQTTSSAPPRRTRFRLNRLRTMWSVAAVAILMLLAGFMARGRFSRTAPNATPRTVVLGTIGGPDSTLALAVREGLRSGLEADGAIHVLGESRTRATLLLMGRQIERPLTSAIALEVAQRTGASLVIVGSAVPVGGGVQIVAEALDPASGDAVLTLHEQPELGRAVVAITRLGERLRAQALGSRARAERPLPAVMTSSIDALRDYALARQALARADRDGALRYAEAAIEHDSLFPMANYLLGDLEWFGDRQRACERHLARALAMKDRLTVRERLMVEARYQQVVADNSDSALTYWYRLHAAYPDDGQAFEGMAWSYRAMGRFAEAAIAADSALQVDSTTYAASVTNKMYALIDAGDTTALLTWTRTLPLEAAWVERQSRFLTALRARDWLRALAVYGAPTDRAPMASSDPRRSPALPYRHLALLYAGRVAEAAPLVRDIQRLWPGHQYTPRAILAQARSEVLHGGATRAQLSQAAREALAWTEAADLSAPAISRLVERIAELAVRARDSITIAAARRLLERRDAGRNLPSYHLAMLTVDAAAAFLRSDMRTAAAFAEAARQGMFHGRSLAHIALLEADARASLGQIEAARDLYRRLLTPDAFAGGDLEIWPLIEQEAEARLKSPPQRRVNEL